MYPEEEKDEIKNEYEHIKGEPHYRAASLNLSKTGRLRTAKTKEKEGKYFL